MSRYLLSWKVGGEAGFGIKSAGLTFARSINRAGYEVFGYLEYPSLIRGGNNTYQLTVADVPVRSAAQQVDVLVALNDESLHSHFGELNHGGAVIYDKNTVTRVPIARVRELNVHLLHIPFADIAREAGGLIIMRNTVALGASQALVGLPFRILSSVIKKTLGHKSSSLEKNLKAARLGYDFVRKSYPDLHFKIHLQVTSSPEELLIAGNEALGLGALAAGVQFYAGYPMTPSSSLLHFFAAHAASERMIVKHAEDEISVINMALGASHVGARTMIGTSGGGFSLMVEALGLAGVTETPLVILEAQRPGPATGLPTWSEQGDLRFVLHAAQGEFPRIILAPGDHEECFYQGALAFNLADQYQLPVIILSDKFLAESDRTVLPFDAHTVKINRGRAVISDQQIQATKDYRRYKVTADGVSSRSIPGQKGGVYLANSDEHDEYGFSNEESVNRIAQVKKRAAKLHAASLHLGGAHLYGNPRAHITVVGWGSTKGPIQDAIAWLPDRLRRKVNQLHINVIWPFPSERVHEILARSRKILLVENNSTAQLGGLIRQQTGFHIEHKMLRFDGRPMYPSDIKERIMSL